MGRIATSDLAQMDLYIRQGKFAKVSQFLNQLSVKSIPRRQCLDVANLARRVHEYSLASKILNPVVRTKNNLVQPASEDELICYAETLRKLGASREAKVILNSIDSEKYPQVLLFSSFCDFSVWDYQAAIPKLKSYIRSPAITDYDVIMGKLNLASAYVHSAAYQADAAGLLDELRQTTAGENFKLLLGHVLELSANHEISQGRFDRAYMFLNQGEMHLKGASGIPQLWLQVRRAIAESLEANAVSENLLRVRNLAEKKERHETVRECDLYIGHISKDEALLNKVYFGTPFASFRDYILLLTQSWYSPPETFIRTHQGVGPVHILNIASAQYNNREPFLKVGQVPHRLLILLARDSYRPLSITSAFGELFPEEYFNSYSSGDRIHQAVHRLKKALKSENVPLDIVNLDESYQLKIGPGFGLVIDQTVDISGPEEVQWHVVRQKFTDHCTNVDLARALNTSRTSCNRLLSWAIRRNYASKRPAGAKTIYCLKAS